MKQFTFLLMLLMPLISAQLTAQNDFANINEAYKQSADLNKPIMLVFSGSDWCKPCIALKKNILETQEFAAVSDRLIMMILDFPYKKVNQLSKAEKEHNEGLAEQFNPDGQFPRVVFIDADGRLVSELSYRKGMQSESFIEDLKRIIRAYETN